MRHILGWGRGNLAFLNVGKIEHNCRFYKDGISGHFKYFPETLEVLGHNKVAIFLYRDPRDIIVSWAKWIDTDRAHHWFIYVDNTLFQAYPQIMRLKRLTLESPEVVDMRKVEDPIMKFIEWLPGTFLAFAGWLKRPDVLKVTYEGLITDPEKELAPIAEATRDSLDELVERSKFRGGWTYRKGIVGDWKNEFAQEHIKAFENRYSTIMELYGYA